MKALKQYMQLEDGKRSLAAAMEEAQPVQLQFGLKKVPPASKAMNIKM